MYDLDEGLWTHGLTDASSSVFAWLIAGVAVAREPAIRVDADAG